MRLGRATKKILQIVVDGAGAWILMSQPTGIFKLERYFDDVKRLRLRDLRKRLYQLEKSGLVMLSGETVTLSSMGKALFEDSNLYSHAIEKTKWDGTWYLVCYDIPEYSKKERDAFRDHLKFWGFLQIQDSLWVLPYNCKEDVAILAHSLDISPYVVYMTTDHLPMEKRLAVRFNMEEEYANMRNL